MQLNFQNERILAVVAHPDDAELLCAGTLARAKLRDHADIAVCVLCNGEKGQPNPPIDNLAEVRRLEMKAAADVLDATLFWLGFPDGELVDNHETRTALVEALRTFRPTLVIGHSSIDYHPDHQAASKLTEAVTWFCTSNGFVTESLALPNPPELWWMDTIDMHGFEPGFYVDVGSFLNLKREMLECHKSQLARGEDADFSPLEELMLRQAAARGAQCGVDAAEAFRIHNAWKRAAAW